MSSSLSSLICSVNSSPPTVSVLKTQLEDFARGAGSTLLRLAREEQARLPSQIEQAKKGLAQAIRAIEDEIAEWKSLGQDYMNDRPRAQRKVAELEDELREVKERATKRFDEFVHPEVSRRLCVVLTD